MGRIVFIDFDGTFADRGVIPDQHIDAVRAARRRGHRIVLCTGRPKALVTPEELALFDGLVGAAGGYVELDGEVLSDRRFPAELARRAIEVLDAHHVVYLLEGPQAVYARRGSLQRIRDLLHVEVDGEPLTGKAGHDILAAIEEVDDPGACSFAKITAFDADAPMPEIAAELAPELGLVPSSLAALGDRAGELFMADLNKSVGVEVMTQRLGIDRADIVAIGDGYNDLEMLEYADTAVVIAGAPEPVLAVADLVIPPPEQAGLVEGFARLGLTA